MARQRSLRAPRRRAQPLWRHTRGGGGALAHARMHAAGGGRRTDAVPGVGAVSRAAAQGGPCRRGGHASARRRGPTARLSHLRGTRVWRPRTHEHHITAAARAHPPRRHPCRCDRVGERALPSQEVACVAAPRTCRHKCHARAAQRGAPLLSHCMQGPPMCARAAVRASPRPNEMRMRSRGHSGAAVPTARMMSGRGKFPQQGNSHMRAPRRRQGSAA